ncbi:MULTISPECIES: heme ABC transporter permease CcmC [unclassified Caballeronia]|uniref:heme ABC transporter permease CcmC n=1 Tax=unclassified Caballeronia TaxID=2646786 RepID=UPI00285E4916|nr:MULTISPECIES: heme ABC transporter permease CcmC [unclassified Caballeronia]MDR5750284.1 heme ABC transporter permease CcmC [Caballeronia sp. LZ024]MDR5844955.1 heme ABC transporter permease CcmC [Caballeronia sp. LZ031]
MSTSSATNRTPIHWFRYASPKMFDALARRLIPLFGCAALALLAAGLYIAFAVAPTDAVQGEVYRIMFIHVPAAWMSMLIYVVMAGYAALGLVLNARLAAMMARALAPTGALFTFVALASGALWGRPTWGAWWVWDARLTSELILLFLYLGFLALHAAIDDAPRADRACAVLALAGVVNIPVIYFSVQWWYTLHQGASLGFGSGVAMAPSMLGGIVAMTLSLWSYAIAVVLARMRVIVRVREGAVPGHAEGRLR